MLKSTNKTPPISNADVESAYERWVPLYDWIFSRVLQPGQRAAVSAINAGGPHANVLNVGVGTGLELPMFNSDVRITGIDLSAPMLELARQRAADLKLRNVEELVVMDAMDMQFADGSFDAVIAPYVLTVVPDPLRMLDEIARVVKQGGELVIVNHISAEKGLIAWFEACLAQRADKIGWNPRFSWSVVADWLNGRADIELLERRAVAPCGLFTLMRFRRNAKAPS